MVANSALYDTLLTQLSQLSPLRAFEADAKVPAGARYPPQHCDFRMPPVDAAATLPPEEREDYFSLTFKTLKAPVRKFTLHTSSIRTVAQVKRHLSRVSNIPVSTMRLVLGGKGLVDSKLIGDYPIQSDSVIQIISRPAGSADPDADKATEVVAADEANPLSSVLEKEGDGSSSHPTSIVASAVSNKRSVEAQSTVAGHESDDESDDEAGVMTELTKDQLKQSNGAFRNELRQLVSRQFGASQATSVNRLLDSYFASL
ncbi:hypothetical protein EC988_004960 [Linderina pennispora]|nr:hypothetical protein EC988_004960 [Linderina pennispora]